VFAISLALLILPNALDVRPATPTGRIARLSDLLVGTAFWIFWFAIFRRAWVGLALAAVLALSWWPIEVFLRGQVGAPVTSLFVGMAFESNPAELRDFLATHGPRLVPAVLALLAWSVFAVAVLRRHGLAWHHRSRQWVLVALPALALLLAARAQWASGGAPPGEPAVLMPMGQDDPQARVLDGVFPIDGVLAVHRYLGERERVRALRQRIAGFRFGATARDAADAAETLVLVIGESSRADRWQLGGHPRPNNPRLAGEPNGVFLRNVISRSVATRTAVPAIVARRPVLDDTGQPNATVEPSVLVALAEAGFATAWFSNQGSTEVDAAVSFHALDAQDLRFLNPGSYAETGSLDERLLRPLEEALARQGRQVIVLHTLGSHFNYANRYPAAFDLFQPSLSTPGHAFDRGTSNAAEIANAYDNSIAYTDHVLAEVIERVRRQGRRAAVLFVSDHGEDLYEPGCFDMGLVRNSAASFRVAAYAWISPALAAARPALLPALRDGAGRAQANDMVFDTLLDLARVDVPAVEPRPAGVGLFDSTRTAQRHVFNQRGQRADFDLAERTNRCRIGP
jgi:glucan phosphoethanolaminetransferase (alkaline phosphatase superfamily)